MIKRKKVWVLVPVEIDLVVEDTEDPKNVPRCGGVTMPNFADTTLAYMLGLTAESRKEAVTYMRCIAPKR